jgi:hypothetical protein
MKRTILITMLTAAGLFAQSAPAPTTKTTSTAPATKKTKKAPKSTTVKPASSTKVANKKAAQSKTAPSAPVKP